MNVSRLVCKRCLLPLALIVPLVAACDQDGPAQASTVTPVEITRSTASVIDGMLLADYPGPKGQIHYAGQPDPDFFCNTKDMLYVYRVPEQLRTIRAMFVQDMGKADWERPQGHWIDATQAFYVAGASRRGSMGPTLATFAREDDARRFAQQYGGQLVRLPELTLDLLMPPDDKLGTFKP